MNTVLTIVNDNVNLQHQHVLVYLKPATSSNDWEAAAWQSCSPQSGGGSHKLDAIINEIGAYISFDNDASKSAYQIIPQQYASTVVEYGNVLTLGVPALDSINLTAQQCGIRNLTTRSDIYAVWCVNKNSIGRLNNPMYNGGFSSFELTPKAYFTIGSSVNTDTFKVQNWDELVGINLSPNLISADIVVKLDEATNKINFTMCNAIYG